MLEPDPAVPKLAGEAEQVENDVNTNSCSDALLAAFASFPYEVLNPSPLTALIQNVMMDLRDRCHSSPTQGLWLEG